MKNILIILFLSLTGFIQCHESGTSGDHYSPGSTSNKLVIDINKLTYTVARDHDNFYSFIGVRALAMVHLAIHDILNSEEPLFKHYYWQKDDVVGNPLAAAIESTRSILLKAYPGRKDTIQLVCDNWLASLKDTTGLQQGIETGKEVASAYIGLRENDGHEKQGDYTPMTKPGDYQYTPGNGVWVLRPDFSVARPFTLDSVTQFRSPEPPPLNSTEYALSFNEVKEYGNKNSTKRSKDQTNIAHWWAEFGEHSWNRIGRITAKEKGLSLNETNRMFALLNMNLYDLYIASLESKYHYNTWRPYTAIINADKDGNPATQPEAVWEPEMQTPPWPEYPSAHAAVGAAGAQIVSSVFGSSDIPFSMESVTALPDSKTRSYENLDNAALDCADSRIMNGFHFRFATEQGIRQGRLIAKHTLANFLTPE